LAYAFIIVKVRVNGDPKYAPYRHGTRLKKTENLLKTSSVDEANSGGFEEFWQFQEYYKFIVSFSEHRQGNV